VKANNINMIKYTRPLIATLLMSGGLLQLAAPVLADTAAGTPISNTATASYEDPADPGKQLNTTSNTVVVQVSEVAGITVTATGVAKTTGAGTAVEGGDTVQFSYTVTNTGNDPSKLRITDVAGIAGPGELQNVEYSEDGGTTWAVVPQGGINSASKAPGQSVLVRVNVKVSANAPSGQDITVTLGNTATAGLQNQPYIAGGANATAGDIYTVDNADGTNGDTAGVPSNIASEAAAFQKITVGATPQAYATVTKTRNGGVSATNTVSYDLALEVESTAPSGSTKIAEDLAATAIKLDTVTTNKILVSDAVPTGTKAKSLVAPAGWTAVYTTDAVTTNANAAAWLTAPANLSTVAGPITRVGFVKDGANAIITKGTIVPGFKVEVEIIDPATGLKIANIAQVFGTTKLNAAGDPNPAKPVYDESGDAQPNNVNDDGTEPATNPVTSGLVDPATLTTPDTDSANTNTGKGSAGEPNLIAYVPAAQQGILNGPSGTPSAAGPTSTNDDFTNKSTAIPADKTTRDPVTGELPKLDPAPVTFTNTFVSETASPVSLLPQAGNLPVGTVVTITYNSPTGPVEKQYKVIAGATVSSPNVLVDNIPGATTATPLIVTTVAAGTPVNYAVATDLPDQTAQLQGFAVPVVAFVDAGTPGLDPADKQNTTIDRLYTGYLDVKKEAQILAADGTVVEDYTATPTKTATTGQKIKYRINYKNISDATNSGSGSVGLNAANIKVTEDGATLPNTWADKTTHQTNSAADTNNGVISFSDGVNASSNTGAVTKYVDTVAGPLAGQVAGSFTFTRTVK
jgi:hypothetical protein